MRDVFDIAIVLGLAFGMTAVALLICMGWTALNETIGIVIRRLSLSRFRVSQLFAATAVVCVLMVFLRLAGVLEMPLAFVVMVGALLLPFALALVQFCSLLCSDCVEVFTARRIRRNLSDRIDVGNDDSGTEED